MSLHVILMKIKTKGYYPVLAHPERYLYMDDDDYKQLKYMGVKFQLNLFSLYGIYGRDVQKKAQKLQKAGMYEYTGTDLHRLKTLKIVLRRNN